MKVLFVDDEPALLEGIERMLFDGPLEWEIRSATSAVEALQVLAQEPFDVVVSDMRMPGMDGAEFLTRVHRGFPSMVRIVLTGEMSEELTLRVLPVAHQFLAKPCAAGEITALIQDTYRLLELVQGAAVKAIVGQVARLPGLPQTFTRLTNLLESNKAGAGDVAHILSTDPGASAKVLQLANSAFFARRTQTSDLKTAVMRLGLKTVRSLLLHSELFDSSLALAHWNPGELQILQTRALKIAATARHIMANHPLAEEAFMAGLLSDVGCLVIASGKSTAWLDLKQSCTFGEHPSPASERAALGTTHAEVGAYLLGVWGLPFGIVEAVAAHHDAASVVNPRLGVAAAVNIASSLVMAEPPDPALVARLGLESEVGHWCVSEKLGKDAL